MVVLTERTLEENKQVAASKKEEVRGRDDSQSEVRKQTPGLGADASERGLPARG